MGATIRMLGGPIPFREALTSELEAVGFDVDSEREPDAVVVYASPEEQWDVIAELGPRIPTVAVLDELSIENYVRALASGAGAVHFDIASSAMVEIIEAAIRGETLLPTAVTTALARHRPPTTADVMAEPFTPIEEEIAERLLSGATISMIARETNYADRTIRRKIRGIYLKLGVSNRSEALAALHQRASNGSQQPH